MESLAPEVANGADIYQLLEISPDVTESEIRKAYRKASVKYHPDKNPSQDAADKFQLLLIALETLTTPSLKAKYDQLYRARREQVLRTEALGHERRKLKTDLEQREAQLLDERGQRQQRQQQQKRKVDILKEEGLKRRKTKDDAMWSTVSTTTGKSPTPPMDNPSDRTVLIKWDDRLPEGKNVTQPQLKHLFRSFGSIDSISINSKNAKDSVMLIMFHDPEAANLCATLLTQKNYPEKDAFFTTIRSIYYKPSSDHTPLKRGAKPKSALYTLKDHQTIEEKIARIRLKLS